MKSRNLLVLPIHNLRTLELKPKILVQEGYPRTIATFKSASCSSEVLKVEPAGPRQQNFVLCTSDVLCVSPADQICGCTFPLSLGYTAGTYNGGRWNPSFEHDKVLDGYVRDYSVEWCQGSTKHRGSDEKPGRVVTLVSNKGARAFRLKGDAGQQQEELKGIEDREDEYDQRLEVNLYTNASGDKPVLKGAYTFMSSEKSQAWLGPTSREEAAAQIACAEGPSGPNCEYLFRFQDTLQELGQRNEEVDRLVERVRQLQAENDGSNQSDSTDLSRLS